MVEPFGKSTYDAVRCLSYLKVQAKTISIKLMSEKVRAEFGRQGKRVSLLSVVSRLGPVGFEPTTKGL
jgi:hypothetical protein